MAYTVTSDTVGLAIGLVAETANDVHEALSKARQMYDAGFANVSIADQAGHKIDGDELLDCIAAKKKITEDLRKARTHKSGSVSALAECPLRSESDRDAVSIAVQRSRRSRLAGVLCQI